MSTLPSLWKIRILMVRSVFNYIYGFKIAFNVPITTSDHFPIPDNTKELFYCPFIFSTTLNTIYFCSEQYNSTNPSIFTPFTI